MYNRTKTFIKASGTEPARFIEDVNGVNDVANSTLLLKLDLEESRLPYTITKFENRIDLISEDIYGSSKYSWILLYINRISISELKKNQVIEYIPLSVLESIYSAV